MDHVWWFAIPNPGFGSGDETRIRLAPYKSSTGTSSGLSPQVFANSVNRSMSCRWRAAYLKAAMELQVQPEEALHRANKEQR